MKRRIALAFYSRPARLSDMSLLSNIDYLTNAPGVVAVTVEHATGREHRGSVNWHSALDGVLTLFKRTGEAGMRAIIGKHTIVVQRESDEVVALVLPTGHAIAKSLHRMIRRQAAKS